MKRGFLLAAGVGLLLALPTMAAAQGDGARAYWKAPANTHSAGTWMMWIDGNANGFNPSIPVDGAAFSTRVFLVNYTPFFNLFGRRNQVSITQPFGVVEGTSTGVSALNLGVATKGRADLAASWAINLLGAPAQTLEEYSQWQQKTILDAQVVVTAPTGQYDEERFLNVGTNRWTFRFGLPFVQSFGSLEPGSRWTLEVLPTVMLFSDNDALRSLDIVDGAPVFVSRSLSQDPLFRVEGHITHDITSDLWFSGDALFAFGGETSLDGVPSDDAQSSVGLGFTLAYNVSDKVSFRAQYGDMLTDETDGIDFSMLWLRMTYAWNPTADRLAKQAAEARK